MIETLKAYQAWRRGDDERTLEDTGLTPAMIGEAIDWAIGVAEERDALSAQVEKLQKEVFKLQCFDVDVIRCLKTIAFEHNRADITRYQQLARDCMDRISAGNKANELAAQVEQMRQSLEWARDRAEDGYVWEEQDIESVSEKLLKTPAQCLAEIKAQAVEGEYKDLLYVVANQYDGNDTTEWSIGANHVFRLFAKEVTKRANQYANQIRQQAKENTQ